MIVNEIFYSIQGEGGRAGTANVFVRLTGCKAKNACYSLGVRCDTEFESGQEMSPEEIIETAKKIAPRCCWIIWTGGEPADKLTQEIVNFVKASGYKQAIETSGLFPVPPGLDYIVVSPKVAEHVIKKNFENQIVDELRYIRHAGQMAIPQPSIMARRYFLSPHFEGNSLNNENLQACIDLVKQHPKWELSPQMHKLWRVH